MLRSTAWFWVILAVLVAGIYGSLTVYRRQPPAHLVQAPRAAAARTEFPPRKVEFSLIDSDGRPFDAARLRGRYWLVSYFYACCPMACVKLNNGLLAVQREFADSELGFLSITCDPRRDTPAALTEYIRRNGYDQQPEKWKFLTGTMEDLRTVGRESFNLAVEEITHTNRVVIVFPDGTARESFQLVDPELDLPPLRARLRELLAGDPPPGSGPEAAEAAEQTAAAP